MYNVAFNNYLFCVKTGNSRAVAVGQARGISEWQFLILVWVT